LCDAGIGAYVAEVRAAIIVKQHLVVIGKVRNRKIDLAIVVVIADAMPIEANSRPSLFNAKT